MRSDYDFSKAKRAKDVPHLAKLQTAAGKGKTRITIMLDNDVLSAFRARAEAEGRGYQTAINEALRAAIASGNAPLTVATLRVELRKAMKAALPA
ncbi:MAG: BrnA antitoxin family protein [Proteobacteria bacterium]|nr:BrnA antitoxin family protein [Pseudomonadota bacterium]